MSKTSIISKWPVLLVPAMLLSLSACGGGSANTGDASKTAAPTANKGSTDTFTINFMITGAQDENLLNTKYLNPKFKALYPNVTIKYTQITDLDKAVTAGDIPDAFDVTANAIPKLQSLGLTMDISPLLKADQVDLTKVEPSLLSILQSLGGKGAGMIALPDKPLGFPYLACYALAYNKDIFDKFAVPYPKDDMTWDQVIELSKRFRVSSEGIQYYGLEIFNPYVALMNQLNTTYENAEGKVDLSGPNWTKMLQVFKNATLAQGNWSGTLSGTLDNFQKDKNVAMMAGPVNQLLRSAETLSKTLNFDLATYPHFDGMPVTDPYTSGFYVLSSKSKHKDAVMDMFVSTFDDDADQKAFENPASLKMHLAAVKNQKIGFTLPNKDIDALNKVYRQSLVDMVAKNEDVNTVLREMQQQMQQAVDQSAK